MLKQILVLGLLTLSHVEAGEQKDNTFLIEEPFKPKPSSPIPPGWRITILDKSKIDNQIPLDSNRSITISSTVYKLEPNSENGTFILEEPGFDPDKSIKQTDTLGAILTEFTEKTVTLADKIKGIISQIEAQLPEPEPKPKAQTNQKK